VERAIQAIARFSLVCQVPQAGQWHGLNHKRKSGNMNSTLLKTVFKCVAARPCLRANRQPGRGPSVRMLYAWSTLTNPIIFNNISNGLNGFQFSYDIPPGQVQLVLRAYATANLSMHDDALWARYRLGEVFKVQDPTTSQPRSQSMVRQQKLSHGPAGTRFSSWSSRQAHVRLCRPRSTVDCRAL
jgi:hypothetical protein